MMLGAVLAALLAIASTTAAIEPAVQLDLSQCTPSVSDDGGIVCLLTADDQGLWAFPPGMPSPMLLVGDSKATIVVSLEGGAPLAPGGPKRSQQVRP